MFGISMNLKKKRSVWEISSLDENKLFKIFTTQEKQLLDFHRKHFTRIYPAGARVDSSNYDPIASYNAGSQIGRFIMIYPSCSQFPDWRHANDAQLLQIHGKWRTLFWLRS
jgi:hypothetical protein